MPLLLLLAATANPDAAADDDDLVPRYIPRQTTLITSTATVAKSSPSFHNQTSKNKNSNNINNSTKIMTIARFGLWGVLQLLPVAAQGPASESSPCARPHMASPTIA